MWNPFKRNSKAAASPENIFDSPNFDEELFAEQLERYSNLQMLACTFMRFPEYVMIQRDWEFEMDLENDDGWIRLHPYPEIMPERYYNIRYIGEKPLDVAVDELMENFFLEKYDNFRI